MTADDATRTKQTHPNIGAVPQDDTPEIRRGILEAHNRWCFAKDLPFRTVEEIETLTLPRSVPNVEKEEERDEIMPSDGIHYYVKWKESPTPSNITESRLQEAVDVIRNDPTAKGDQPPAQIWINGYLQAMLLEPATLSDVLETVEKIPSLHLSVKRSSSDDNSTVILRVERYFRGGLRHKQDIFDHIVDNLYAMEDITVLEDNEEETTIIGSATLPDWIMGGDLTSRLHIHADKKNGSILFRRPLYHDDLQTSDRKFRLNKGVDDHLIEIVLIEIDRLTYLAKLPLPFPGITSKKESHEQTGIKADKVAAMASFTTRERQHRRNRRRFFGL
ncbi:hypothetical protein IV203_027723 [Nitzschia inconspicua]|uniref:Uncharacterized protein n=1 Tax=Nitzschia inconspicua TaxID=303405 RepID=A0A9K3LX75_9STRA|nr:hypothetical protein IV203_027723 [Nitzschia inconspicua]